MTSYLSSTGQRSCKAPILFGKANLSILFFQGCNRDGEVRVRSLALLDEMGRRYEEEEEPRTLKETIEVLEEKCENLQEELASIR